MNKYYLKSDLKFDPVQMLKRIKLCKYSTTCLFNTDLTIFSTQFLTSHPCFKTDFMGNVKKILHYFKLPNAFCTT